MVSKSGLFFALVALVNVTFATEQLRAIVSRSRRTTIDPRSLLKRDDTDPETLYPAYNLSVPIDHFHNDSKYEPHSSDSFNLRYWFDATYYKPGGPVIVLQSGETDGTGRLRFLQKGILHQLAVATNGVGVVLEHRYYGTSIPTPDFSTENLRYLTTDQALADEAYFAQHVVFKGLEQYNLTAPTTPYIGYGGSYAGAFVAFLRKLYPDVFWGTISSSGVTEAIWDYWAYFEPIRVYGEPTCITYAQKITNMVDNILMKVNTTDTTAELKGAFGLPNVTYDDDFAVVLSAGIGSWQGRNWDPDLNDPTFDEFCSNITSTLVEYSSTTGLVGTAQDLLTKGGYGSEISTLQTPLLNWIGWLKNTTVSRCKGSQDSCYSTHNSTYYQQDSISDDWRAWPYQYCTEWGYLQTGSGVPADQLPLITRLNDLEYASIVCREAFNISTPANVTAINQYGGFNISYPRFAIVDGEQDPWRPACPSASPFNSTAVNRTSTVSEPFMLIEGAVHHWDENGLFANQTVDVPPDFLPPLPVRDTQAMLKAVVLEWMEEWKLSQAGKELK
ncbi:putative serine protease K12H4.7 [Amylocarpus encephaloides]|uniref:Serine protease K12H4.7 n=1 Tax=Amylocarpus encephaloides TaxID=45428 RepID=A0A9P7YNT7_9HELO|nr:putative serine protease K12H4.7 [Amylocarpus encephaloides]